MITKVGIYCDPRKDRPHIVRWFGEPDLDGRQKRYSKSFERKRDAEAFRAEKMAAFQKGERRDRPKEISVKDFCENWLRIRGPGLRHGTRKLYRLTIDRIVAHFGPTTPVSKIGAMAAEKFIAGLQPERKEKQGKGLSTWTRQKMLRHCKTIFQKAVAWDLIPVNPFHEIRPFKLVTTRWYYLLPVEYTRLLDVAPTLQVKAMYAFGYTAGLRFGEMVSLTWANIDFERGEVVIENREATPTMPPFSVKDYETRRIPLPKHTLDILRELQAKTLFKCPFILLNEQRYQAVMENWRTFQKQGRIWENRDMMNNVNRELRRHLKKADIKPNGSFSLHTLRKCAGKNWADVLPPHVTKELMGHSSIATTMKYYSQVDDSQRTRAAAVIDGLIAKAADKTDAQLTPKTNLAS
jgi:integrase